MDWGEARQGVEAFNSRAPGCHRAVVTKDLVTRPAQETHEAGRSLRDDAGVATDGP